MKPATTLVAVTAALALAGASHGQGIGDLSKRDRIDFVAGLKDSCVSTQRGDPANASISDQLIDRYCSCLAETMVDRVSTAEVYAMGETNVIPPEVQERIDQASVECGRVFRTK